jgi:predicted porin
LSTPFFRGAQLAYNNLTGFADNKITLEPSIRLYTQRDEQGSTLTRVSPGVRGTYNFSKRTSVLGEGSLERSTNRGPTNNATTSAGFFYVGMRYELF